MTSDSTTRETATLLVCCPDRKGLVANISDFIFRHGGNILPADQHTDLEAGIFLTRIEWELHGFQLSREQIRPKFQAIAGDFQMQFEIFFSDQISKVAILVSRLPHCLQDLLLRQKAGDFKAQIVLVISNHPDAADISRSFGIGFRLFPITTENKTEQEKSEIEVLHSNGIELIVLARYMQVLSDRFVAEFPNRIINIHHSFPPPSWAPNPTTKPTSEASS